MAYAQTYTICSGECSDTRTARQTLQEWPKSSCPKPREFELPGDDAIMRKDRDRLIIESAPPRSLLALLATLAPLEEQLPAIADEKPDALDI